MLLWPFAGPAVAGTNTANPPVAPLTSVSIPGIPSLDEMAGDWIPMSDVANPPAVHNCNQMLVVDRDLTSFFCNPGILYPWQHGYPVVKLFLGGQEYPATETRCHAYRALRRNLECDGLAVETDTRLVNEQRGVRCRVTATNLAAKLLKSTLTSRFWLVPNPRSGSVLFITRTNGYDHKYRDKIAGYAFNACSIFKTADEYWRVTGDRAFLNEKLEDGKTVLDHLDALATDWETLPKGPHGLVNYGENRNRLECAPAYNHCVASLNAQDVWMIRRAAEWLTLHGEVACAKDLQDKAAAFLPTVLGLYKSGVGVWNAYHPNGTLVELRHCVDYIHRRTAVVTREGPFAQAREFFGPNKRDYDAPVRVAMRLGCMKECISGVAFADVILNTIFGFSPAVDGHMLVDDPQIPRPFEGTLTGICYREELLQLAASNGGITITGDRTAGRVH